MPTKGRKRKLRPAQSQARQPGVASKMRPRPVSRFARRRGSGRLAGRVALITGGDSGIGRAAAVAFAREGADVAIVYLREHKDARETARLVQDEGRRCPRIAGDVGDARFCARAIAKTLRELGRLDVLVNNAAEQHPQEDFAAVTPEQVERTFRTNVFGAFHMTRAALPHLKNGAAVVNTTSVTAYRGSGHLVDYAATKAALVGFTRSLALMLVKKGIRVNAVAPGPVWTPLIPATFDAKDVATFGSDVPMGRAGEPAEIAECFVFLASDDASYMTGQVLHPNGGEVVNG